MMLFINIKHLNKKNERKTNVRLLGHLKYDLWFFGQRKIGWRYYGRRNISCSCGANLVCKVGVAFFI